MIDSHSHLYCEAFDEDRDEVMQRARDAGITHIVLPGESADTVERQLAMRQGWHECISIAVGLHPEEVKSDYITRLEQLEPFFQTAEPVAVGEVGIDLYWDRTFRHEQQEALYTQLMWAVRLDLPFILHCREALEDCIAVLKRFPASDRPSGVWHCFPGDADDARRVLDNGDFYIGVGGTATFKKNETTRNMIATVGLEKILLETDSPYLAPVPNRGKRNESSFLPLVANTVATTLGTDVNTVETITTANACDLFNLQLHQE